MFDKLKPKLPTDKVTSADVLNKMDELKEKSASARAKWLTPSKLRGAVTIIMVLLAMLFSYTASQNRDAYAKEINENKALMRQINDELNKRQEEKKVIDNTVPSAVQVDLASARDVGSKIAELQNAYRTLDLKSDSDRAKSVANYKVLGEYFAAGLSDAGDTWYTNGKGRTVDSKDVNEWSYVAPHTFKGGKVDMLWECRNKESGELMAIAYGVYDTGTKKMISLDWGSTMTGSKAVSAEGNTPVAPVTTEPTKR